MLLLEEGFIFIDAQDHGEYMCIIRITAARNIEQLINREADAAVKIKSSVLRTQTIPCC